MRKIFQQIVGKLVADEVIRKLNKIERKLNEIMATQQDAANQLNEVKSTLTKVGAETSTLIDMVKALQDQVQAGGTVTPELQAAVDGVVEQAKKVDDMVPDAPTP